MASLKCNDLRNAPQNLCLSSPCKKVCLLEIFNRVLDFFFRRETGLTSKMNTVLYGKERKFLPPSSFSLHFNCILYRSNTFTEQTPTATSLPGAFAPPGTLLPLPALINLCPKGLYKPLLGKSNLSLLCPHIPTACCQAFPFRHFLPFSQILTHTHLEKKNNISTKKSTHGNIHRNETNPTGQRLWEFRGKKKNLFFGLFLKFPTLFSCFTKQALRCHFSNIHSYCTVKVHS